MRKQKHLTVRKNPRDQFSPTGVFGEQTDIRSDQQALEDFVLANPELDELEILLDQFNIFEAMRAERTEIRHSDFLAFLMDPGRPHGLGDSVLKSILQAVLKAKGDYPAGVTPVDLDSWDMMGASVSREEFNTDILVRYEYAGRKLIVLIENKIDSAEHSDQLRRYYDGVAASDTQAQIIAIYLTPDGEQPSDDRFLPLDYESVADLLGDLIDRRRNQLGEAVGLAIEHYVNMLRRHIVAESEVARLAKVICTKHRRAIDIIFEHRPDSRTLIVEQLKTMIGNTPGLTLTRASKSHVSFTIDKLAKIPKMDSGEANYYIGNRTQLLYVEFNLTETDVGLRMVVGPGPDALRKKIVEKAQTKSDLFKTAGGALGAKWKTILSRKVLNKNELVDVGQVTVPMRLNSWWSDFRGQTLPAVTSALEGLTFT